MNPDTIEDVYGLSPMQSGMLFHTLYAAESCVYLDQVVHTLEGELNTEAFEQTWAHLVSRHPILRTSFHWEEVEEPLQVVHSATQLVIQRLDWRTFSEIEQQANLVELLKQDRDVGVNLSQPPLMRVTLIHCGERSWQLLWTVHHLLLDRWSVSLVLSELKAVYQAFRSGRKIELPAIRPYSDYIGWLQEQDKPKAESYWRRTLAGIEAPTALPIDRAPGDLPGRKLPSREELHLSDEATTALQSLGRRHRLTLNTLVQGAWALLLSRYSGTEDVMFGATVSGRPPSLHGVESMVGMFINSLPVRVQVPGESSLLPWLHDLQESLVELREYEYSSLVEIQGWSEIPRGVPLFDSLVLVQNTPAETRSDEETLGLKVAGSSSSVDFPLMVMVVPGTQLRLVVSYDSDRFERPAIERLLVHYQMLLESIVADPRQKISCLALLTQPERSQLLVEWNDTSCEYPRSLCLHQVFEEQVHRTPDAVALVFEGEELSYSQLNARANQLAHLLRQQGVQPNTLAAVCMVRSIDMVVAILAILKAGGAYVAVDPAYPADRIRYTLEDASASVILTQEALLAQLPITDARTVCPDRDAELIGAQPTNDLHCSTRPTDLAYVLYTSGSTGRPKGVAIEHHSPVALVSWALGQLTEQELSGVVFATSICFDLSVYELFVTLCGGGRVLLVENALAIGSLSKQLCPSLINTVPSAMTELLRQEAVPSTVVRVNLAGEPLTGSLVDAIYDQTNVCKVYDLYGPSEDTTYSTCALRERGGTVTIGRPISNTRVYILDRSMHPVPLGVPGELYIGGEGLSRGYLNRSDLTAEKFIPDPFSGEAGARLYRTGDLCCYLSDGNIEYLGRLDHQVKIRGFRIELGEIESALLSHAGVREAVVLAREDIPGDRRLAAYVSTEQSAISAGQLREHLLDKLPGYMIPAVFVLLEELPRTPNGKVDRKALPAPDASRPDIESAYAPPRNEIEALLVQIWGDVLRLERVGIHDNFFELGGDSILSIQIISRANQSGMHLTPRQVFKHHTIAGLAAVIDAEPSVQSNKGVDVAANTPLTPIQRWFFERDLPDRHHFNQGYLLLMRRRIPSTDVERACQLLVEHHDALRLRFVYGESGWRQTHAVSENQPFFSLIDLSGLPRADQSHAITATCSQLQSSLRLADGPLLRVAYFDLGYDQPTRLFIVVHHLVVDGVSWRILLSDMAAALEKLERVEAPTLAAPTTSFQYWAQRLSEYAQSTELLQEQDYWLSADRLDVPCMPFDHPEGPNAIASQCVLDVSLSAEETRTLLKEVPAAYHTQINDVLLSALAQSLGIWMCERRILIDLEGHGREPLFDDADLSRTVGWFTSLFPVLLELPPVSDPGAIVKSVKEQLRSIPHHGIGYGLLRYLNEDAETRDRLAMLPQAQVSFNYLGQFDQLFSEEALFEAAPESAGSMIGNLGKRSHELGVLSQIRQGRLQVEWFFSEQVFLRSTVEHIADSFVTSLRAIIAHCQSPEAGGFTPSDFPMARISQNMLDRLPASSTDVYGLSPMQSGMLFHTLYAAEPGVYLDQVVYAIEGDINDELLEQAWKFLITRHGVLRTSFQWEWLEDPLQVVHNHAPLLSQRLDWSGISEIEQQANLVEFLTQDRDLGVNLSQPPLMRLIIVHTGRRTWQMLLTYHHLIVDRWSVTLLLSELKAVYQAFRSGRKIELPAIRPYSDYIGWLQEQDKPKAESYWRRTLAGIEAPTALPIDRAPGDLPGRKLPSREELHLSDEATTALQSLGRRHRLTLNTLVQGAWALLLSRYSGTEDVMFGATVSGRPPSLHGVESMVGMFINSLPVRVQVPGESSLLPWLHDLQESLVELREYEYSSLVEIQGWSEIPRGVPLFDSLVLVQNTPELRSDEDVFDISVAGSTSSVDFPLLLVAMPGSKLRLVVSYDSDRFERPAIERLLVHYQMLLESIVADPRQKISCLALLTQPERSQLLVEWNDTSCEYPRSLCLHQVFEEQVHRTPDAVALVFEGEELSYSQLNARANQLAHLLRQQGVQPNTLAAVCMARSIDMVVAILAILKAGGAYVAVDPAYPADRIRYTLEDASASVILTQEALLAQLPITDARTVCPDRDAELIGAQPTNDLHCSTRPTDLAYVLYTSGSTGRPKGVAIEHHSPVALVSWALGQLTEQELSGVVFATSICFDLSVYELFVTLCGGGRVLLVENALAIGSLSKQLCPSLINTVPSAMTELLRQEAVPSTVVRVNLAGEPLTGSLVDAIYDQTNVCKVYDLYGPSEDTTYSTCALRERGGTVTIGRPISNTRVYILDRSMHPVPLGVPGELYIGGEGLSRGYLNRSDLTAEKFIPDPFSGEAGARLYRTGDLCCYLSDGNIEYLGRLDHQVKIRGFRIELGEIECALLSHVDVQAAAVIAREDILGDKRLTAYIGSGNGALNVKLLREHISHVLPGYMVPSMFVFLESLPLTPNGKVDRKALPEPDANMLQEDRYVAPRTPIEEGLAEIWSTVLHIAPVGVHDNFFELGGHSLLATQVISRVRNTFQIELTLRTLFEAPTIAGLANAITGSNKDCVETLPVVSVARDRPLPLSFSQQRLWLAHRLDPSNSAYNVPCINRVSGVLSVPALQRALDMVVTRHEILRTTYREENGLPTQVISPDSNLQITFVDCSQSTNTDYDAVLQSAVVETKAPFNLATGPVVRAALYRLSQTDHVFALTMHHIVADGWSVPLVMKEIVTLYDAEIEHRPQSLEDLPVQYADYAVWQRARQETDAIRQQTTYWQTHLAGAPETIRLPFDRPRPRKRSLSGATMHRELDTQVSEGLRSLANEEGATLFMLLLACYNVSLYSLYEEEDIVVGTDVAGRSRAELEGLVGFFVNQLVLRTSLSGNPSIRELIPRVRHTALEAYANQDVPLDTLVELLRPERDPSYTPLFQVLFVMNNAPSEIADSSTISLARAQFDTCTSKFDLALFFRERVHDHSLYCHWVYATDVFESGTIRQMAERFETVASLMVSKPETRLSDLKDELLAADVLRRKTRQQQRGNAENYPKFQRIKPQAQCAVASLAESSLQGDQSHTD